MRFICGAPRSTKRRTHGQADGELTVRIRGMSSAIPGFNGVPGASISTETICRGLREQYGIHNPKNGKGLADDWAVRYLNMTHIAIGRKPEGMEGRVPPEEMQFDGEITEEELMFRSFDEALEKAQTKVEDIDVLIYVSCTVDNVYFNQAGIDWYKRYPKLSKRLQLIILPYGCPALVHALRMANQLLQSPENTNVAIVISNCTSKFGVEERHRQALCKDNNLLRWINCVIFGDAAFSCILSTSTKNLPKRTYKLLDADIVCDPDLFISSRGSINLDDGGDPMDVFCLNPKGPEAIPDSLRYWLTSLRAKYGYSLKSFQHIVFHQANPKVINMVCDHFKCADKTSVIGSKFGNLAGTSVGCALHHRLELSEKSPKDGDLVLGYALGALTGNSHGVFILKCDYREE